MKRVFLSNWIISLALLSICLSANLHAAQMVVYKVGVVPQFDARKLNAIWQPIIDYLENETGYQFELQGTPSISDFEEAFLNGQFDFAYMNPFHMVLANKQVGYKPLLRDIERSLRGVLVVKKGSSINSVAGLDGQKIAFPSPNALGASLQMRQELHDIFNITFEPRYVKTHDSVYLNVLLDQVAAGGGVGKTLNRQAPEYRAALKVIHRTKPVSPHPFAVHPKIPDTVAIKVKQALLSLKDSQEGSELLSKIPMKMIGPATMSDYEPLQKLNLERFYVK